MMDGGGLNSDTAPVGHAIQRLPPLSLPPSDTKQGETKERGGEGGELLTTPIWRRFRAGAGAAFSSLPDQSRGCVCVYVLWLVVSNVMVAVAMAHLKNHNPRV